MSQYTPPNPDAQRQIMDFARMLVCMAKGAGFVVTIERQPLKPLAMGNAEYLLEVRPERKPE